MSCRSRRKSGSCRQAGWRNTHRATTSVMTPEHTRRDYRALFHPEELRSTLLLVSLYVLAYESFREGAIDHVRMLYANGLDEDGWKFDEEEYKREILSRHKSPFAASLDWYREMGAVDDADLTSIRLLTDTRNRLVHDLWKLIGTSKLAPDLEAFSELLRVYRKLEVWQVINLELAGDEEWEGREIDEDAVVPGPIMMMRILTDVALGKDEDAWLYYNKLIKKPEPGGSADGHAS